MKDFIYNEMMVHVPLCTHKEPENILIISDDSEKLENEVKKHINIHSKAIKCSLEEISKLEENTYDVVVTQANTDPLFASQINRVLKEDGIMVTVHPDLEQVEENKALINTLSSYFKIIMPYNLGTGSTALFASKTYHPTADIILQRTDMLDNLDYYNCDVHPAAFAMGNNVRKTYLGMLKN